MQTAPWSRLRSQWSRAPSALRAIHRARQYARCAIRVTVSSGSHIRRQALRGGAGRRPKPEHGFPCLNLARLVAGLFAFTGAADSFAAFYAAWSAAFACSRLSAAGALVVRRGPDPSAALLFPGQDQSAGTASGALCSGLKAKASKAIAPAVNPRSRPVHRLVW